MSVNLDVTDPAANKSLSVTGSMSESGKYFRESSFVSTK
jgi:hypothetical protein